MNSKMIARILPLIFLTGFFFCCDDFKDEEYELSELDRAVTSIIRDALLIIEIDLDDLTKFDATWFGSEIYSNISRILDTLAKYDQELIIQDSCYRIDISGSDSSYFYVETNQAGEFVFCFNEPIKFELIDDSGIILTNKSNSYSLEEVAGGVTYYTDENFKQTLEYYIALKNTYDLEANRYLGRIIKTDMITETVVKTVIKATI
ncbi:MAG: hypothetical protein ABIA75_06310 [Candidatus Neomarinimicrobiota bacterium]